MVILLPFMLGMVNVELSTMLVASLGFHGSSVELLPFRNQQSSGKQDQHSAGHVYSINGTYKDKRRLTSLSSGSMSIDQPTTRVLWYDGVRSAASLRGSPFLPFVQLFVRLARLLVPAGHPVCSQLPLLIASPLPLAPADRSVGNCPGN